MSFKSYFLVFSLSFVYACSASPEKPPKLSQKEKSAVEQYAKSLVYSINQGDHELIRNSFKYDAFPAMVTNLSRSEQMVFDYIFDKELKDDIKFHNVEVINQMQALKGKVHLGRVAHHSGFSEIQLIIQFEEQIDFLKYRVEIIRERPYLVDYYYLKEGHWFSETAKNLVLISSEYNSLSEERKEAYTAYKRSQTAFYEDDIWGALYYLNQVPKSHWIGDGISLTKLQYASILGDSAYSATLDKVAQKSQNLFIQYQRAMVKEDSVSYLKHLDLIKAEVGNEKLIDSLIEQGFIWF